MEKPEYVKDERLEPEKEMMRQEFWKDVKKCLTDVQYEIIQYIFVEGKTLHEIEAITGLEYQTISMISRQALATLENEIDHDYKELLR